MVQVLHKFCKAIIIRRDVSGIDGKTVCKLDAKTFDLHRGKRKNTFLLQLRHRLLHGKKHPHLSRQDIPLLHPVCHTLPKLQLHSPRVLLDPKRLIKIDTAVSVL